MDAPAELSGWIWDEWKKKNRNKADQAEMKAFLEKECREWNK